MKLVTLLSGGLDSVTLAYLLRNLGHKQILVTVDYKQRHIKEIFFASACASRLEIPLVTVNVSRVFGADALTGSRGVPTGEYTVETLAATIVPNRNAIFANLAAAIAVRENFDGIALAIHAGDHPVYPDCRPEFVEALKVLLTVANDRPLEVEVPFLKYEKYQIVALGKTLGVPFSRTWSCYKGGDLHCGACSTCLERKEAFRLAGVTDPTRYKG